MSHASSGRPVVIDLTMESPSKQPTTKPTKKLVEPLAKAPTKKPTKQRAKKQKQAEASKAETKQDLNEQLEKAKEELAKAEATEAEVPVYVPGMAFEEYVTAQQTQFDTFQGVYKRAKVEGLGPGRTLLGASPDWNWLRMFQAEEPVFQKLKNLCAHQLRETKASAWSPLLQINVQGDTGKVDKFRSLLDASPDVVQQVEAILEQQEVYVRCGLYGYGFEVEKVSLLRTTVGGQQQWWHADGAHSVIIALQDDTTLLCKFATPCRLLTHEGQFVVFGPEFKHAEGTYLSTNVRLHAHLVRRVAATRYLFGYTHTGLQQPTEEEDQAKLRSRQWKPKQQKPKKPNKRPQYAPGDCIPYVAKRPQYAPGDCIQEEPSQEEPSQTPTKKQRSQ